MDTTIISTQILLFLQIFHEIIVHKVVMYKVSSLLNYGALIKVKVDRTPAELTSANDCFHIDLLYITNKKTKRHTQMASVNDSYQVENLFWKYNISLHLCHCDKNFISKGSMFITRSQHCSIQSSLNSSEPKKPFDGAPFLLLL